MAKFLFIPIITALLLAGVAQAQPRTQRTVQETPRFGLHGMVLFTDGVTLLASHLPMFHAPHDVQVVLRIHLADAVMQQRLVDKLWQSPSDYWTLEPERFDLNQLAPTHQQPLKIFRASLYQGHFERGGQKQSESLVEVEQVLWFSPLSANEARPSQFRLISLQAQSCVYAYHIGKQPSFDQILLVKPSTNEQTLTCPASIAAPDNAAAAAAAVRADLPYNIITVYLETADLQ